MFHLYIKSIAHSETPTSRDRITWVILVLKNRSYKINKTYNLLVHSVLYCSISPSNIKEYNISKPLQAPEQALT